MTTTTGATDMTAKNHNKKRNSLLIYEFLVRTISQSLIEDDKKKSAAALKILRRHFRSGTELYKEFRLMNALAKTTVSSDHVAASILKEAKSASEKFDDKKLDREKSILIRHINHTLNDENFYDQHVNEYRTLATIQTLVNEWRSEDKDIHKVAQFEDHIMKYLVTEKQVTPDSTISEDTSGSARLLMKVMTKKLNEKYSGVLNDQQKSLIKAYAYSTASDDQTSIKMKLKEVREELLSLVESYTSEVQNNDYLKNKLQETRQALLEETIQEVDDATVTRFMLYSRLKAELETKE
jgi:hypothetical protein